MKSKKILECSNIINTVKTLMTQNNAIVEWKVITQQNTKSAI